MRTHWKRMQMVCLVLALMFAGVPLSPIALSDEPVFDRIKRDHEFVEKDFGHRGVLAAQIWTRAELNQKLFDVKHYRLQINLRPDVPSLQGSVTIHGETTGAVETISVDAEQNLNIDAVRFDGSPRSFRRRQGGIEIDFPGLTTAGRSFSIDIDYHGTPVISNLLGGGMLVTEHPAGGAPVMASLSEPYAAPTWWPCIDDPTDKATSEIEATAPRGYQVASNGVLEQTIENADDTTTFFWRESFPIATYLISIAATNYVTFEDTYTALDGATRMPLVYYVYPEHLSPAQQKFAVTRRALEIFASLFGEYPFLSEKYGMAEFPWGGAMEHQTITSMGAGIVGSETNNGELIIAHELAHHWWGDLVTMKTWDDIWLNEGFATYSEVLFFERHSNLDAGELMIRSYDDGKTFGRLGGTVTAENPENPFDDRGAIYTKGAWVLHMLRRLLGDQKFFDALNDYRVRHAFSNASTSDFQRVCELQFGGSLDWFFQQWVYAAGRPVYKVSSEISGADGLGNYTATLVIKQKQSHQIPGREKSIYIMPLDVTIQFADGTSEKRVVWNDSRKQRFTFEFAKRPLNLLVDEDSWVLKKIK